jgi:hypothetical protein
MISYISSFFTTRSRRQTSGIETTAYRPLLDKPTGKSILKKTNNNRNGVFEPTSGGGHQTTPLTKHATNPMLVEIMAEFPDFFDIQAQRMKNTTLNPKTGKLEYSEKHEFSTMASYMNAARIGVDPRKFTVEQIGSDEPPLVFLVVQKRKVEFEPRNEIYYV